MTEREPDVSKLTEPELIEIVANIETSVQPIGRLAMNEYYNRRADAIDAAIEERITKQGELL